MIADRELLGMAAKAYGLSIEFDADGIPFCSNCSDATWNPLTDDGDALRLLVRLNMHFEACQWQDLDFVQAGIENPNYHHHYLDTERTEWLAEESGKPDRFAAARRAIVRAAAEIGRAEFGNFGCKLMIVT